MRGRVDNCQKANIKHDNSASHIKSILLGQLKQTPSESWQKIVRLIRNVIQAVGNGTACSTVGKPLAKWSKSDLSHPCGTVKYACFAYSFLECVLSESLDLSSNGHLRFELGVTQFLPHGHHFVNHATALSKCAGSQQFCHLQSISCYALHIGLP